VGLTKFLGLTVLESFMEVSKGFEKV